MMMMIIIISRHLPQYPFPFGLVSTYTEKLNVGYRWCLPPLNPTTQETPHIYTNPPPPQQNTAFPYQTPHSHRYHSHQVLPRYPFGHGLSYTSFTYSAMQLLQPLPQLCGAVAVFDVCVAFNVSNTGVRDGAEVAQLYVTYPAQADEPPRQLRFFSKVKGEG